MPRRKARQSPRSHKELHADFLNAAIAATPLTGSLVYDRKHLEKVRHGLAMADAVRKDPTYGRATPRQRIDVDNLVAELRREERIAVTRLKVHEAEAAAAQAELELARAAFEAEVERLEATLNGKRRQHETTLEVVRRARPAIEAEQQRGRRNLAAIVKELADVTLPTYRRACAELDGTATRKH